MKEKAQNAFLFFLFVIFLFIFAASSNPLIGSEPVKSSDPESHTTLSLQLHHVDTLFPNKTPEQLFRLKIQRDAARFKLFTAVAAAPNKTRPGSPGPGSGFTSPLVSGLAQGSGEYFTRIGVGTPPRFVSLIVDTGSDITWLQCSPCQKCYNQTDPIFHPRNSTSFAGIRCTSPLCQRLDQSGCNQKKRCQYLVSYGDGSSSSGVFATETLTFGKTSLDRVAIGCGNDNEGIFRGAAGILGVGGGSVSFSSQTGSRFNKKFSYCLVDRLSREPSSLVFGDSAIPRTARFTPMLKNPQAEAYYYVELLGISVGGVPVRDISPPEFRLSPDGNGGVIIDSGTTVTQLTDPAYVAFRNAFRAATTHLKRGPDYEIFDTCYNVSGIAEVKVPTVVLHFRGADVSLSTANVLVSVESDEKGLFCFAFTGSPGPLSIIGNIQQQGIRVAYDLAGSRVGFAPGEC